MADYLADSKVYMDLDHCGWTTEEEMEADLMRIDAMEDQEVTSRFRAGFTMGELQSSAIPTRLSLPMLDSFLMKI